MAKQMTGTQEPPTELARRIALALSESDYRNQSHLAADLNTTSQTVNRWIKQGRVPEWKHLERLPGLLGVSGHWLLTGEEPMVVPRDTPLREASSREKAYDEIEKIILKQRGRDARRFGKPK